MSRWILFLFLWWPNWANCFDLSNGDCLDFDAFNYFRHSPGFGYDPDKGIDGFECSKLCSDSNMPHAGLVQNRYCLCARESSFEEIRGIAKVTDELCTTTDYYVRYYRGELKQKISGLSVKPNKDSALISEEVFFELTATNDNVEFSVDFGDGSDASEWSISSSLKHQYFMSGMFTVTVNARLANKPEEIALEVASIRIQAEIQNENLQVHCPTVVEPFDNVDCNITLVSGTQMQMKMDFGDGYYSNFTNLPDIPINYVGISIPQTPRSEITFTKEEELKNFELVVTPIPRGVLSLLGSVLAVEGYGAEPGQMFVYILRKVCGEEQDCSGNSVSCFEPGALCASSKMCNNECQPFNRKNIQYRIVKKFDLLITEGQFYLTSRSSFRLFSDDLVGFKMENAQLAYRSLREGEQPDYKIEMGSNTIEVFESNKFQPITDRKFYIRLLVSEPLTLTMNHVYVNSGTFPIRFLARNTFSSKEVKRDNYISIQSTISKMRFLVNPPNAAVGQKVEINAQLNKGSNIKLIWDYGDGKQETDNIPIIKSNQKFTKNYEYPSPGVYLIQVLATNLQGNTSAEHEIIIEHPVLKQWKVSSDSPKLLPEPVKFTVSYPEELQLPTNASLFINFGDGKRHIWRIPEDSEEWTGEYETTHVYQKSGLFNVDVEISNTVSRIKKRFQVDVLKKIQGLAVDSRLYTVDGKQKSIEFQTPEVIALGSTVNFRTEVQSGDVEHFLVRINNELYRNSTSNTVNVTFSENGIYHLRFSGYNHIQKSSAFVSRIVYVLEPVKGLQIVDLNSGNLTSEPELKKFIIEIQRIGTNSCLLIDYGERLRDESDYFTYGEAENCKQLFPGIKSTHSPVLNNSFGVSKKYAKPRDYDLKFTLANLLSKEVQETSVTVLEIDCKQPIIHIKNQIIYWRAATQVWRSKPVQLYSKTYIDCNATIDINRFWTAFRIDERNGNILEEISLADLDSYSKSFLYVPAFHLQPATYMFQFAINITSPFPHPVLPFFVTGNTYIKVVPSPIIARLTDGAQSRVVRGWGQKIKFSPRIASFDPDDERNKNFEIKWYCRRMPDEYINNLLPDERQNFSEPIYDRSNIDEEWGDDDGGGCFGQGPGRINITDDAIEWNTTYFRKPETTYEMVIQIIPPDREPSWGALQLVLLKTKPPSVMVQCQTKALCYPHFPIGQKINPVRVGLEGMCTESCEGELKYEWNIYGVTNSSETQLKEAGKYVVGYNEAKMALGIEFFEEYYPKFKDFFLRLSVTNELNLKGDSDIFLHINQPPEGGECSFKTKPIRALLDKLTVKCFMWIDPEDKPIEFYAFWTKNLNDGVLSFLMYGPDKNVDLILPYGNFTVGVDIRDKEGALTRLSLTNVTTILPTLQEYEEFMNSKALDNTDASGDQAEMSMVAQALSSLLNIQMERNSPLSRMTTTTTTTTTTTASYDYIDENEVDRVAQTKARIVKSVSAMMNVDTLNSLEQVGSALTALAGKGQAVDNDAKEVIIKLLNKTVSMASTLQVESPQQLMDFCRFAVGTMGGIVNRMTEQIVSGVVLPTDKSKGWSLDYKVEVPDVDDEPDYIMDAKTSVEDALKKAVIRAERQAAELQIRQMIELTIELVLSILKNIVIGEKPIEFAAPSGLTLTIAMYPKGSLSNKVIKHEDSTYVFPHVCDILANQECFGNETLGILAVSWPSILESFGNSVDLLSEDTKTLQLLVIDESLNILDVRNTTQPFSIIVPRKSSDDESANEESDTLPEPTYVVPKLKFYEKMIYHQVMVEKADSAVNIEISPSNNDSEILLYVKHREKPFFDYFDILIPLKAVKTRNGDSYDIFLNNQVIKNKTGFFYVGVVEVDRQELAQTSEGYVLDEIILNEDVDSNYTITNYTLPGALREFSTNYSMRIFTSGCYFYDYHRKVWSADGCLVDSANYAMTHCKCNHLTSFGSGFFIMPNSIDFSYVFANAGFADNVTIYMTIVITLTLYAILMVWARKNDREDLMKLGSTPLPDNELTAKYLYEIVVYTGDKDGAGTDSKIQFILSGDDEESDIRTLEDPFRKTFQRGDTNSFVMAVNKRLGRLNYVRIWHDNSGEGKFRSWFLSFIVVKDIQTGEKYEFICNKWLAVEKDDGLIDRLLPVAGKDEATEFSHLFHQTTQKNLADGHLWFSIFMRPPRSRFTRMQRVSCCMSLLYLSMLVNAMWYERVPSKPSSSSLEIGPFSLSPEQIGVGFMSNLIVFPPTFLIILLFRRSRLRKLRPSRITEALRKQRVYVEQMNLKASDKSLKKEVRLSNINQKSQERIIKKSTKRLTLPYWFKYVGWGLCFLSMAISIFFLWAYGIQFGDEKTRKWITSLIVSFFASILVTQPIKVFLTAIILSTIFKSPEVDIDDSEEDEDDIDLTMLEENEEYLHETYSLGKTRSRKYRSPNMSLLEKIKFQRLNELKMMMILKDIFSYLCFLWLLTVISYGNRDPGAYLMKESLVKTIVDGSNHGVNYRDIKTSDDMWLWTNKTLIPSLLIGDWYNGYKPLGLRGFLNDRVNRMMGYGILRQVRVKPNTCVTEIHFKNVIDRCRAFSNIINEDRMSYLPGWIGESENSYVNESLPMSKSGFLNPSKSRKDEWNYRTPSELDGLPFLGKLDIYSGGGYVLALKGSREDLHERIEQLRYQRWIDERTRAVIAEFSVYNAQANLFGIVSCVFEFQPGGGIIPNYRIDVIRLMRYHQGFGLFVVLCEIFYLTFIIYFTVREIKCWKNQGRHYLQSYWNWAEIFVIVSSYCAVGLYIFRTILTYQILSVFNQTHGNGYVKLQYVSTVDEIFGYFLAFIMFVAILKFIRLLRFNKRMGVLYATLAQCSKDLKSFSIVFCIVFFAFVQMFYLLFGLTMKEYSSFVNSMETTFGMVTGKFNFNEMVIAAPLLGPVVFFIFVLCTSIILVNIFLTLIISAFETVKHDVMKQDNEYEIIEFMQKKVKSMFGLYQFNLDLQDDEVVDENEKQLKLIEEQIANLPSKVDHLLYLLNKTANKQSDQRNESKSGTLLYDILEVDQLANNDSNVTGKSQKNRTRNRRRSNSNWNQRAPKISFLDWNEVD